MPAHLAPRSDRRWVFGALCVAFGVGLLTVGALGFGTRPPDASGPSALPPTTEATVLGVTVTRPDAGEVVGTAPAAVPATFELDASSDDGDEDEDDASSGSGGAVEPRGGGTTTTVGVDIGTPTSVTNTTLPFPTTTTTVEETTTTTEAPTTTEPPPTTEGP